MRSSGDDLGGALIRGLGNLIRGGGRNLPPNVDDALNVVRQQLAGGASEVPLNTSGSSANVFGNTPPESPVGSFITDNAEPTVYGNQLNLGLRNPKGTVALDETISTRGRTVPVGTKIGGRIFNPDAVTTPEAKDFLNTMLEQYQPSYGPVSNPRQSSGQGVLDFDSVREPGGPLATIPQSPVDGGRRFTAAGDQRPRFPLDDVTTRFNAEQRRSARLAAEADEAARLAEGRRRFMERQARSMEAGPGEVRPDFRPEAERLGYGREGGPLVIRQSDVLTEQTPPVARRVPVTSTVDPNTDVVTQFGRGIRERFANRVPQDRSVASVARNAMAGVMQDSLSDPYVQAAIAGTTGVVGVPLVASLISQSDKTQGEMMREQGELPLTDQQETAPAFGTNLLGDVPRSIEMYDLTTSPISAAIAMAFRNGMNSNKDLNEVVLGAAGSGDTAAQRILAEEEDRRGNGGAQNVIKMTDGSRSDRNALQDQYDPTGGQVRRATEPLSPEMYKSAADYFAAVKNYASQPDITNDLVEAATAMAIEQQTDADLAAWAAEHPHLMYQLQQRMMRNPNAIEQTPASVRGEEAVSSLGSDPNQSAATFATSLNSSDLTQASRPMVFETLQPLDVNMQRLLARA